MQSGLQVFANSLADFFSLNDKDGELVYQLRNSLMHSFGLGTLKVNGCQLDVAFKEKEGLITEYQPNRKIIDLWVLYKKFEDAILGYRVALKADPTLQDRFARTYRLHGSFATYRLPPDLPIAAAAYPNKGLEAISSPQSYCSTACNFGLIPKTSG